MTDVDNPEDITVLSLCSGYGGLELGVARALANPLRVVAVEIEAYALANLVAKAEAGSLAVEALWPDLRTFPAERFRDRTCIVVAGFPCQPFSVAGKRKGGTDERYLWTLICRVIETVRPVYVLLENVPGLLSARILDNRPDLVEYLAALAQEERKADARGRWYIGEHRRRLTARLLQQEGIQAYAGVYLDLQDLAYDVEPGLFTAAECGAPHKRERLFILAESGRTRSSPEQDRGQNHRGTCNSSTGASGQLADGPSPRCTGTEGQHGSGPSLLPARSGEHGGTLWPARPGEPQYDWEEPRVVGNAQRQHKNGRADGAGGRQRQSEEDVCAHRRESRQKDVLGQAQPGVGLQSHGTAKRLDRSACRVDELRLLGNGVVPQQAEKAFRTLWSISHG